MHNQLSAMSLIALGVVEMGGIMDKPTFESIVDEHGTYMRRRLRALRVPENDLADVAQAVLVAVHRGLPAFDPARAECPESAVSAWVNTICQHQASNYHRARRRRGERECLEADFDHEQAEAADSEVPATTGP